MPSDHGKALRLRGVGKFYPRNPRPISMFRYLVPTRVKPRPGDLWALRDVSFELERGKVLGVVGKNGSGKSTLLQLVAGLLKPSEGEIDVQGTTAALIELGAGFNPEFTGRENVMLNGAIYGYSRAEMERRIDEIVDFAELPDFIEQPVKTYSSGMFARLAFAVAIQVDPDVLLVDEILSVGDLEFQAKCFRRIEALCDSGTSILFVSHDLNVVQMLCDRAILLHEGRLVHEGPPKETTDRYIHTISQAAGSAPRRGVPAKPAEGVRVELTDIELIDAQGRKTVRPRAGEPCRIRYQVKFYDDVERPVVNLQVRTMLGLTVYDQTNLFAGKPLPSFKAGQILKVTFGLELNLCPGPFRIAAGVSETRGEALIPLYGTEELAIEVISDRRAYGIAFLKSDITLDYEP